MVDELRVGIVGLEPTHREISDPKSDASAKFRQIPKIFIMPENFQHNSHHPMVF